MMFVGFFITCCVGGSPEVVGAKAELLEKPALSAEHQHLACLIVAYIVLVKLLTARKGRDATGANRRPVIAGVRWYDGC